MAETKTKVKKVGFLDRIFENEHRVSMIVPVVAGVLYLAFCMLNLTSSIWFDESYSAYLVRGSFSQIWNETALDVHPPLFYFALKIWSSIFGTTDVAMRFMPVFFGLLSIIVLYQLVKKVLGVKAATISTLLVSISPMFVRYGQEMRMYTMLSFILIMATYFLVQALENFDKKGGQKWLILYAIFVALGMWTQYFAALMFLTHVVIICWYFGGIKKTFGDKKVRRTWLLTYGLAIVLFLPWMPWFLKQVNSVEKGFWIGEVSMMTPINLLSKSLVFKDASDVKSWLFILVAIVLALAIWLIVRAYRNGDEKTGKGIEFFGILAACPVVILLLLSLPPLKPTFVDRYILYAIVFLFVIFGLAIVFGKSKKIGAIFMVGIIATSAIGIVNVENREPSGYIKEILAEVFASADDGEPILANTAWTYYDSIFYTSEKHPIYGVESWINYEWGSLDPIKQYRVNLISESDSPEFFLEHNKVWYIVDADKKYNDLPEELAGYEIKSEISLDKHTAWELERR